LVIGTDQTENETMVRIQGGTVHHAGGSRDYRFEITAGTPSELAQAKAAATRAGWDAPGWYIEPDALAFRCTTTDGKAAIALVREFEAFR
jgi:hypothetical protein